MARAKPTAKSLKDYLALNYPFIAQVAEDGEYYVLFPDLDGLYTGAPTLEELPAMMREGLELWLTGAFEQRHELPMPEPTVTTLDDISSDYSGKFNLRIPRSLHRTLADGAERDGVSLNQYVLSLLAARNRNEAVERRLDAIERTLGAATPPQSKIVAERRARYGTGGTKKPAKKRTTRRRP